MRPSPVSCANSNAAVIPARCVRSARPGRFAADIAENYAVPGAPSQARGAPPCAQATSGTACNAEFIVMRSRILEGPDFRSF